MHCYHYNAHNYNVTSSSQFFLNLTDVYSEISFSEDSCRAGTSQLICDENHLAHYCILRVFAGDVSEQI